MDCALLVGPQFPNDREAEKELVAGLPFLDVSLVDQADFDYFATRFFAFDRLGEEKGLIEVIE